MCGPWAAGKRPTKSFAHEMQENDREGQKLFSDKEIRWPWYLRHKEKNMATPPGISMLGVEDDSQIHVTFADCEEEEDKELPNKRG